MLEGGNHDRINLKNKILYISKLHSYRVCVMQSKRTLTTEYNNDLNLPRTKWRSARTAAAGSLNKKEEYMIIPLLVHLNAPLGTDLAQQRSQSLRDDAIKKDKEI